MWSERNWLPVLAPSGDSVEALLADTADCAGFVTKPPFFFRRDQPRAITAIADKAGYMVLVRQFPACRRRNRRLFALAGHDRRLFVFLLAEARRSSAT